MFLSVRTLFGLAMLPASIALAAVPPTSHAALRLGNQNGNAIILSCLSDTELNATAAAGDHAHTFGWQFASADFACKVNPSAFKTMPAECTYTPDDAHFIDFFFTSVEACTAFEQAIAPACKDAPAADCLEFLEHLFRSHPITLERIKA